MRGKVLWLLWSVGITCGVTRAQAVEWDGVVWRQDAPAGMAAWLVLPSQMVLDNADLPQQAAPQPLELKAARGEYECVQLVLRLSATMQNVSVGFSDWTSGANRIASGAWKANKVGLVPGKVALRSALTIKTFTLPKAGTEKINQIPDPLLPESTFVLEGNALNRIWLTVRVPENTAPGRYNGRVQLRANGNEVLSLPLSLVVWNYTLPAETHLVVAGNVWVNGARMKAGRTVSVWDAVRPYFDNLKAHRLNATANPIPFSGLWQKGKPAPDTRAYEQALRYIVDELKFVRFRMGGPGGAASGGLWGGVPVFQKPAGPKNGVWLDGAAFVRSNPSQTTLPGDPVLDSEGQPAAGRVRWNRVSGQGGTAKGESFGAVALLAPRGTNGAWIEYDVEVKNAGPAWLWAQVDPAQKVEKKLFSLDGKSLGTLSGADHWDNALGFARLQTKVLLTPGRHTLRVEFRDMQGIGDALYSIYLTPDEKPDFNQLLRERAVLTPEFKAVFRYHLEQATAHLRRNGWLDEAQIKLKDEPAVGEYGRIAAVYEYAGGVAPGLKRELSEEPYPILRNAADVWTPYASSFRFEVNEAKAGVKPGDEVWIYHNFLHGIGYPSIGMRLIPWMLFRHDLQGYLFWGVTAWGDKSPWTDTHMGSDFLRGGLIYPDPKTGAPVDSIRWELFREGLEDYEALRLLKIAVENARKTKTRDEKIEPLLRRAEAILQNDVPGLVRTPTDFSWEPVALEKLRTQIGETLSALTAVLSAPRS